MKNKFKILVVIILLSLVYINIDVVQAGADSETISSLLEKSGTQANYETADAKNKPGVLIGNILNIFLSLMGVIFLSLAVYGGFIWMNAGGDSEKANKAKDILKDAVIGVVISVAAYAITYFILYIMTKGYVAPATIGDFNN